MKSLAPAAIVLLVTLPLAANAQSPAKETEYQPEEYSERGQTNGCGISFDTVWRADGGEIIGVSGSANFFIVPEHKNVMALIKASAIINETRVPVSYAWLESPAYGRSADFSKGGAADPNAFIGVKNSDAKAMTLVLDLARVGATLGVTLKGRPIDDSVKLPAPPREVAAKVLACFSRLNYRMQSTFR